MRRPITPLASLLAIAAITMAGCGSSARSSSTTDGRTIGPSTTASVPTSTATGGKISANSATQDEIIASLEGAGVRSADRWAREIMEYRPYDSADPTLTSLRRELSKYNPSTDQLTKIMSVLQP